MFQLFKGKIFSLLLFLIFSSSLIAQNGSNTTTLSFYRYNPERLNWEEHKKRAAQMGGHLACISNATENEQVRRIAGGEIVWIGGIRRNCNNGPGSEYWKWSNGKEWTYTNWSVGEPNNHAELNENRVWLYDTGKWNDAPSWVELPAVYEIPSTSLLTDDSQNNASTIMSIVPPSGTWHGQWQTMSGATVIDRGNDDLTLTFHDNGTITGGATDPRNGSFKVTGTWRKNGKVKFTYSNPGNGNDGETAHGQVKGNRMETDWTNRHCSGKAQYEYDQSSLKDINSSDVKNLNVSGAGSVEVNGSYVFVPGEHPNRIFGTIAGHYQHTTNPAIFIGFQNCGKLFNKPEWNKWVIFTEKGARYAAHTNRQINVPPRFGEWETVDHWPSGVQEAGLHPAPTLHHEIPKRTTQREVSNQFSENVHVNTGQPLQNKALPKSLSYYKFIPEKMTWAEHNNRAIAMGGNLASISNALENEQVLKIIYCEGVWIGGIRKGCGNDTGADHWYWSNGKEWVFTNWQQYEPNNYGDVNENRVQMLNNGNWNDLPGEIPMAAVYELPLENTEDYYENTNTNNYKEPKIKKRPFKFILGPVIAIGSFFQFKKIKSREIEN